MFIMSLSVILLEATLQYRMLDARPSHHFISNQMSYCIIITKSKYYFMIWKLNVHYTGDALISIVYQWHSIQHTQFVETRNCNIGTTGPHIENVDKLISNYAHHPCHTIDWFALHGLVAAKQYFRCVCNNINV